MLSKFEYDGELNPSFRRGPFSLPFAHISTYLPDAVAPRFVHVSSAGGLTTMEMGATVAVRTGSQSYHMEELEWD